MQQTTKKTKFDIWAKKLPKSAVKNSIEKNILFSFVSLSKT